MLTDRESCEIQLRLWVEGVSIHNHIREECCPDFSCCSPGVKASSEVRRAFKDAGEDVQHQMFGVFLEAMISAHFKEKGKDSSLVYISTGDEPGPIQ